ncbi:hypothetical protein ARTHRO9V_160230 [Arthrobacter sp. 9V]|nr:hypothetical protein ARTHRO9V_160230 [Arthrobacter sp. 9V]
MPSLRTIDRLVVTSSGKASPGASSLECAGGGKTLSTERVGEMSHAPTREVSRVAFTVSDEDH